MRRKLRTKRGLEKVNSEWSLICTGHNLLKLFRFGEGKPGKARATGPAGNNRDWHGTATRGIFRLLTAYTCPPRTRTVAVGWFHLYPLPVSYSSDGLLAAQGTLPKRRRYLPLGACPRISSERRKASFADLFRDQLALVYPYSEWLTLLKTIIV